jgi:nucleoside-diphosphate-sugar epimerase
MRVLVTGVSGRIGSEVARDFLTHGYEVLGTDKAPLPEDLRGRIEMQYAEITDRMALLRAAEGCDSIAHLAAIPNPGRMDDVLFNINVVGTQYLLDAAMAHGIKRVALASSCCAFGFVFPTHQVDPQYFPVDENHPDLPQDLYGLSKVLNEETAAAYSRRTGMTTISLRLTMVIKLYGEHLHWRRRHLMHNHERRSPEFWSYIDVRDTARAFRLSVEAPVEGSHKLIISARDAFTPYNVPDLIRRHYPALAEFADTSGPHDTPYDTSRAEELIGFVAEHSWRNVPELADVVNEVDSK